MKKNSVWEGSSVRCPLDVYSRSHLNQEVEFIDVELKREVRAFGFKVVNI